MLRITFPRPLFLILLLGVLPATELLAQGGAGGRAGTPVGGAGARAQEGEGGRVLFDARLRFEGVRAAAIENRARALTGRVRTGYETGRLDGVSLLLEVDATRALGLEDFNSGRNGRTTFPVVADPDSERVNRLHLTWHGEGGGRFVAGRQRIIHGDARFVGNVGFRQNEQTFDALRIVTPPVDGFTLDYTWAWQVNRIPGSGLPAGTEDARLHLVQVRGPLAGATLTAFGGWMEFREALAQASGRTLGIRLSGSGTALPAEGDEPEVVAHWLAEFSFQRPDPPPSGGAPDSAPGDRPGTLTQRRLEVGLEVQELGTTLTLSEERLEGDGIRGFSFPLATLHAFQGATDLFLQTPPGGLRDRRATLAWTLPPSATGWLGGASSRLLLGHHTFTLLDPPRLPEEEETGPARAGQEWSAQLRVEPRPRLAVVARMADYRAQDDPGLGQGGRPWERNVRKHWFWVEFALP